jgi:hypothetical protein
MRLKRYKYISCLDNSSRIRFPERKYDPQIFTELLTF